MKERILFVGHCYYYPFYLSRALRKLGWKADVLNIDSNLSNREKFYHGEDYLFEYENDKDNFKQLWFFFYAISKYNIFHFANAHGMFFTQGLDFNVNEYKSSKGLFYQTIFFLYDKIFKWNSSVVSYSGLIVLAIFNVTIFPIIRKLKVHIPYRWDIKLLKKIGKKIVYSNNSCLDGVSQTSFCKWKPYCVCNDCVWKDRPDVCSDKKNLEWGKFRNTFADFQILLGGNRADYNIDTKIHEVPGYYCLDTDFWRPDLQIPNKYKLKNTNNKVILYHAVGNFETRTKDHSQGNIKSTHIYLPLIERLKEEGYNVQLIFAKDIPNKEVRFLMVQADIVLDMLTYGWFGANIREGMMLGKPCICFLRDEWLDQAKKEIPEYINELPIVNSNPDTIYNNLTELITDQNLRQEIGCKSRQFAVKWHSSQNGAQEVNKHLLKILGNGN